MQRVNSIDLRSFQDFFCGFFKTERLIGMAGAFRIELSTLAGKPPSTAHRAPQSRLAGEAGFILLHVKGNDRHEQSEA
ncbi:hypothetical protein [Burkholderia puraquae]|uniref:hypothetical protein n=1 Tax=Burkholderia puraquae TaxID=1904757 RepID=UPI0013FD88BC|nr:hypothetical protein [Burkholderia puraquae]